MLAVVNKPHIEISGDTIPEELLSFLKDHYKKVDIIENDEAYQDITETDCYKKREQKSTPGSTLKRYRKRAELSQVDLAEKLGMVKQNVSSMEKGTRGISKTTAHKLAEIFQTSPGRFI
ncbi:MAG: helix-turn-helix transcriptional regulator, partial [Spirochaetaceae bacterium]|nr:helix-turn-helix transcriptional regulator [Spirochaetaceae bacterium]